jgi:hypothetical protein
VKSVTATSNAHACARRPETRIPRAGPPGRAVISPLQDSNMAANNIAQNRPMSPARAGHAGPIRTHVRLRSIVIADDKIG